MPDGVQMFDKLRDKAILPLSFILTFGTGQLTSKWCNVLGRGLSKPASLYYQPNKHSLRASYSQGKLLQITYQLPAVQVGMRIAVRGDTYASHVNFMNQVMLKAESKSA